VHWGPGQGPWRGIGGGANTPTFMVGDFDGDGRSDIANVYPCPNGSGGNKVCIDVNRSTGSQFAPNLNWVTSGAFWFPDLTNLGAQTFMTLDFNGDGLTDIVQLCTDGGTGLLFIYPFTATGNSVTANLGFATDGFSTQNPQIPWDSGGQFVTGDFSAMGKAG